ncbi:MAG: N-acetyltransferase [Pseudomonadota bacterium]
MLRKAKISDVKEIQAILSLYAQRGQLLGRSLSDLYDQIRDFFVAIDADAHAIVGTGSLHICWEDIAEIRSLSVKEEYKGTGLGTALARICLEEARELGLKKVFVLTYVPEFFKKLGFQSVDKSVLPHKVWGDCVKCVKFPDCDEEAMLLELNNHPV